MLDEQVRKGREQVSYEDWIRYATLDLEQELMNWPSMRKLVNTLGDPEDKYAREARQLLSRVFIPNGTVPVKVNLLARDGDIAQFLAAEGALISTESAGVFQIPSPLVHSLLLQKIASVDRHQPPKLPIPWNVSGWLNIPRLVIGVLSTFNRDTIVRAFRNSFKRNRVPGYPRDAPVPQEAVYHAEFYSILRSWLPSEYMIATEVNISQTSDSKSESRNRCDMVISMASGDSGRVGDGERQQQILEFVATVPREDILDHFEAVEEYANALKANEAWIIHFTVVKENENFKYPWVSD